MKFLGLMGGVRRKGLITPRTVNNHSNQVKTSIITVEVEGLLDSDHRDNRLSEIDHPIGCIYGREEQLAGWWASDSETLRVLGSALFLGMG